MFHVRRVISELFNTFIKNNTFEATILTNTYSFETSLIEYKLQ